VKKELLLLLKANPATAGRPDDFLDTLAEDIQAAIIRAIIPAPYEDHVWELEQHVADVYNDHFGVQLSNLLTTVDFHEKLQLSPSDRKRLVLAMIQTLLIEQDYFRQGLYSESGEQAATLKRRLTDYALPMSTTIN
jgi:hypothetical protein